MKITKFRETEIGKIPEDWDVRPIGALASINEATIKKTYPHTEIDYFDTSSVEKGQILGCERLALKNAPSRAKRIVQDNDILISTVRPNLKHFAFIKHASSNMVASTGFAVITAKKIVPEFLYYYLSTDRFTDYLTAIADAHTSTYPSFNPDVIENSYIPLPDETEQINIAKILSALDSKIALNQQMNETLESIGQALFKRWFVDFQFPDENGNSYKSSGGQMSDSELGEIPKGWTVSKLGDNGTFKNGINYLRNETGDTDFFIANVRNIANNKLLLKEFLDKININLSKAKEYLLQEKDILIARSACPGEISLVLGDLEKVIYSGFSIRYRLNDSNNYLYIFHIMQGLKRNLQNYSIGTTLQSVNQGTLKNMKFILSSDETLKEFGKISKQIINKTLNNLQQNRELSRIRDSLLPRLMSGRIRVSTSSGVANGA